MVKSQEELVEMYQGVQLSCSARLLEGSLETKSMAFGAGERPEQCRATEVGGTQVGCLVGLMALVQGLTAAEEEKKIAAVRVCSQSQCCGYQCCKSFVESWREAGTSQKWSHHTDCSECC